MISFFFSNVEKSGTRGLRIVSTIMTYFFNILDIDSNDISFVQIFLKKGEP